MLAERLKEYGLPVPAARFPHDDGELVLNLRQPADAG